MTKDQINAIVQYTIDVEQHEGGINIDKDKCLSFQVLQLTSNIKVEFTWLGEITKKGIDPETESELDNKTDFFHWTIKEGNLVLHKKIMQVLKEVEQSKLTIN